MIGPAVGDISHFMSSSFACKLIWSESVIIVHSRVIIFIHYQMRETLEDV
jgi:hypothetical protein